MIKKITNLLNKLPSGTYNKIINKNEIIIKVPENNSDINIEYKKDKNTIFIIKYNKETNNYMYIKYIDEQAVMNHNKYIEILEKKYIYNIYNNVIIKKDKDIDFKKNYIIDNNKIHYKIDENTVIEKNLNNDNSYIYLKKYNTTRNNFYIEEDWLKLDYNDRNIENILNYNEKLKKRLTNLNIDNKLQELLKTLTIPKNSPFIKEEMDELIKVSELYNKYKDELLNNNHNLLNEIYYFSSDLITYKSQAKLNALGNYIKENNIDDLDILERIIKQVKSIIKTKKIEKVKKLINNNKK